MLLISHPKPRTYSQSIQLNSSGIPVPNYTLSPPLPPRDGSYAPFSPSKTPFSPAPWTEESQLARALDHLSSGQGAILQQLGHLAVGNPWNVLRELENRTEKEQKKLEQILQEKERMEGVIEGLREQLREERAKFQSKKISTAKDLRNEGNSPREFKSNLDKVVQPSYSKSQIVQANSAGVAQTTGEAYAVDPLHGFASMMQSQIVGQEEHQTQMVGSTKGEKLSVKSRGLSTSKITYNPPSSNTANRNVPREIIESQAVNTGNFVPYYWQGSTPSEQYPVLFDIKPEASIHKSNLTGEADSSYMGKKIVSRFATIIPGQATPNSANDELARLKEMNERLAEENRVLAEMLKGGQAPHDTKQPTPRGTEKSLPEDPSSQHLNYKKLDYFGHRPSIQAKLGAGFMNINLAVPDIRATHFSSKALQGELSPVEETDMDGVRVSGPPEAHEQLKETQLQQLQNYLSPEQPCQETAPNRGYNSVFSFQPSMEMISALTQYVNNPNMTAEQAPQTPNPRVCVCGGFRTERSVAPPWGVWAWGGSGGPGVAPPSWRRKSVAPPARPSTCWVTVLSPHIPPSVCSLSSVTGSVRVGRPSASKPPVSPSTPTVPPPSPGSPPSHPRIPAPYTPECPLSAVLPPPHPLLPTGSGTCPPPPLSSVPTAPPPRTGLSFPTPPPSPRSPSPLPPPPSSTLSPLLSPLPLFSCPPSAPPLTASLLSSPSALLLPDHTLPGALSGLLSAVKAALHAILAPLQALALGVPAARMISTHGLTSTCCGRLRTLWQGLLPC